jgi:hypothetical protein
MSGSISKTSPIRSERLVHALHIGGENQEISGRDCARKHLQRANQHDGRDAEGTYDCNAPGCDGFYAGVADALSQVCTALNLEALLLVLFAAERLHQGYCGEDLGDPVGDLLLLLPLLFG